MAKILEATPGNFSSSVVRNVFFRVKFDEPLDRSTITSSTVILVKTDTEDIVSGVPEYVTGTNTLTFQLQEYLDKFTDYTFIIVGGESGVKDLSGKPWSPQSYLCHFTTGEEIDPNIALAPREIVSNAPVFSGVDGIYKIVWGRTGEPVTHVVTTGAEVGPSGTIVPIPSGPDVYLPGNTIGDIKISSTNPTNGAIDVVTDSIVVTFDAPIKDVAGHVFVTAEDILGNSLTQDVEYVLSDNILTINLIPSGSVYSSIYTVLLTNGIMSQDEKYSLKSDYKFSFRTRIQPFFATIRQIRLLGDIINDVTDEAITQVIYENSLYIQSQGNVNIENPSQYAINYVICKTKLDLLTGKYLSGGPVTQKRLGDFEIQRGRGFAPLISKMVDKLDKCVTKNYNMVVKGYSYTAIETPVKAENDPRYPSWHRLGDVNFGA